MKTKSIMGLGLLLLICGVLYAQTEAALKPGVYRFSGIQGAANVVIKSAGSVRNSWQIILHNTDGSVLYRGTGRIFGSRMNVDYGNNGFETFTIIDETTFEDNNGFTWFWVRGWKNEDL